MIRARINALRLAGDVTTPEARRCARKRREPARTAHLLAALDPEAHRGPVAVHRLRRRVLTGAGRSGAALVYPRSSGASDDAAAELARYASGARRAASSRTCGPSSATDGLPRLRRRRADAEARFAAPCHPHAGCDEQRGAERTSALASAAAKAAISSGGLRAEQQPVASKRWPVFGDVARLRRFGDGTGYYDGVLVRTIFTLSSPPPISVGQWGRVGPCSCTDRESNDPGTAAHAAHASPNRNRRQRASPPRKNTAAASKRPQNFAAEPASPADTPAGNRPDISGVREGRPGPIAVPSDATVVPLREGRPKPAGSSKNIENDGERANHRFDLSAGLREGRAAASFCDSGVFYTEGTCEGRARREKPKRGISRFVSAARRSIGRAPRSSAWRSSARENQQTRRLPRSLDNKSIYSSPGPARGSG